MDFIPLMRYAYGCVPAKLFAMVGYAMFAYLFSWTDANWYVLLEFKSLYPHTRVTLFVALIG